MLPITESHGIRAWPWKITARSRLGRDLAAVDDDGAVARLVEAGQHVEDGGLAAAGMADQADELAAVDAEPDVLEDRGLGTVTEPARQAFDADEGAFKDVLYSG